MTITALALPPTTPEPIHHGGHAHHARPGAHAQSFVASFTLPEEPAAEEVPDRPCDVAPSDESVSQLPISSDAAAGAATAHAQLAAKGRALSTSAALLPLVESESDGPAALEHFFSDHGVDPGSTMSEIHALVTKARRVVAVIDRAGNVFVRSPASEPVREAMCALSSPRDRTTALASLFVGCVESGERYDDLTAALRGLAASQL